MKDTILIVEQWLERNGQIICRTRYKKPDGKWSLWQEEITPYKIMPVVTLPLTMTDYKSYTTKVYDPELQKSLKEFEEWQRTSSSGLMLKD